MKMVLFFLALQVLGFGDPFAPSAIQFQAKNTTRFYFFVCIRVDSRTQFEECNING